MKKTLAICIAAIGTLLNNAPLSAHCQMPCGIYHDDLVFSQIDQFVETMYKGLTVLSENKFASLHDKNEFIRWVYLKEKMCDDTADLFLTYFLQQKIKPGAEDTVKKVNSLHKLVFMLVGIKQHIDLQMILDFNLEWEIFKHMFHPDGYQCAKTKERLEEWEQWEKDQKTKENKVKEKEQDKEKSVPTLPKIPEPNVMPPPPSAKTPIPTMSKK